MTDFVRQDTSQDIYINRDRHGDDFIITYPDGFKLDVPAEALDGDEFDRLLSGVYARLTYEHMLATELRKDWERNAI